MDMSRLLDKLSIYLIKRKWRTLRDRCDTNMEYAIRRKVYEAMVWEILEEPRLNQTKDE